MQNELTVYNIANLPAVEWEDGTPRVLDTDLGAWLGYANPKNGFRQLIRRHEESLQEFGQLTQRVFVVE